MLRIAVVSSDASILRALRDFDAELVSEPSRNGHDPSATADRAAGFDLQPTAGKQGLAVPVPRWL